jgi:hypothetical protein
MVNPSRFLVIGALCARFGAPGKREMCDVTARRADFAHRERHGAAIGGLGGLLRFAA